MTARSIYADPVSYAGSELDKTLERLQRLKTMTRVLEAQLQHREPGLAVLASDMSDEIDGVAEGLALRGCALRDY
ncbi:MAG: hypothetical protein KDB27_26560 [Planctomycetales bacterium]|nr:hypothetical protein [Planctomycetales bacterium]